MHFKRKKLFSSSLLQTLRSDRKETRHQWRTEPIYWDICFFGDKIINTSNIESSNLFLLSTIANSINFQSIWCFVLCWKINISKIVVKLKQLFKVILEYNQFIFDAARKTGEKVQYLQNQIWCQSRYLHIFGVNSKNLYHKFLDSRVCSFKGSYRHLKL